MSSTDTQEFSKLAETKALELLRECGFKGIQEIDWLFVNDVGEWIATEAKGKSLFEPGSNFNHWGCGLNISQLYLRNKLLKEKGIRTYLMEFVPGTTDVYGAYLDELEKGEYYDAKKSCIRIYPLENFSKGEAAIIRDLLSSEEWKSSNKGGLNG